MPEIKNNFAQGKMNKDVDERIVPNGQYRDALNIKISSTDGTNDGIGNAGTVQNLQGNRLVTTTSSTQDYSGNKSKIIGSVADEGNNKVYFFTAAPVPIEGIESITNATITTGYEGATEIQWVDSIVEVESVGDADINKWVFIDKFAVTGTKADTMNTFPSSPANGYTQITVIDGSKYRVGMNIYARDTNGNNLLSDDEKPYAEIIRISDNVITLAKQQTADLNNAVVFLFIHPNRVLEFDYYKGDIFETINIIPSASINILDNLLLWSDGKHEPKKINIDRSIAGTDVSSSLISTQDGKTHTKLCVNEPVVNDLNIISEFEYTLLNGISSDVKKEHITVIKKAPTSPPSIEVNNLDRGQDQDFPIQFNFIQNDIVPVSGDIKYITFPNIIDFRVDDVYNFEASNVINPITIRLKILEIIDGVSTVELLFVDNDLQGPSNTAVTNWLVNLEVKQPFFETKFGRFAYRYQYEDNEYSSFSPFSELAFLPGEFLYTPSKGFNEGMANTAREIIVRDWLPTNYTRPLDVKTIDILWKTTDDANVYIVKSIKRGIDTEWNDMITNSDLSNTGEFTITSEMINRVVDQNQILRAFDNVPRFARAQDVTSNRVVYGNYTQGYNVEANIGLLQTVVSKKVLFPNPKKSIKSLREYQFGIVIGDKYGRETPVISNGYKTSDGQLMPGTSKVSKSLSSFSNKFKLEQSWTDSDPTQLEWMEYIKYYVKETSNEYYNLVLDRVYDAGDNNAWLAFNSADRNKVDEETYLILKNEHGSQIPVDEEARYRILAISNEAPDFIKTDEREFDLIEINKANVYGDDDGNGVANDVTDAIPVSLVDNKTIRTTFFPLDENGNVKDMDFKGIPKARIVAKFTTGGTTYEAKSPLKTISRAFADEDGNSGGVNIRDAFNSGDVNMYQRILTQLPDASALAQATADTNNDFKYFLQIVDAVVENKPQFDGKFFVKVAKDSILENRVLGNSLGEYQVLNTYEVAFISDEATNPALDDNEYASDPSMLYESSSWETIGDFTSSNIGGTTDDLPNFINLNSQLGGSATDNFWTLLSTNTNRTADIFIDNVPAMSGFNLQTTNGVDALTDFNFGYNPINTVDEVTNWNPPGLSNGPFEDGTLGQFVFSIIGPARFSGANSYFKSKMQTTGTLFRFRDDPNQEVYFVETAQEQPIGNSGEVISGPITIESTNFDNDGTSNYVDRTSIIVRFKRLGANGEPIYAGLDPTVWDPRGTVKHNGLTSMTIDFVEKVSVGSLSEDSISTSAACFETEPKEDAGLDIYYEASGAIPVRLKQDNIIAFTGANQVKERASGFSVEDRQVTVSNIVNVNLTGEPFVNQAIGDDGIHIKRIISGGEINLQTIVTDGVSDSICAAIGDVVRFENKNGLVTKSKILDHYKLITTSPVVTAALVPSNRYTLTGDGVNSVVTDIPPFITVSLSDANYSNVTVGMQVTGDNVKPGTFVESIQGASFKLNQTLITEGSSSFTFIDVTGYFKIEKQVWKYSVELGWFNCYSFGNGVESDRIRDDFNAPQIDNGIKVSSTFLEYGEENKTSSMIFSGLYNSTSGVNNLNEFNMAEKITKDLNTDYGSIQAMKTRDNDVVVFAEDKVLRVQSGGKDALFNADGQAQLTATSKVLGTAIPFAGDYGISKNPESLALDAYRMYFSDKQRGAVLRLSNNGIIPISDAGMKTYFRENLKYHINISGSFDGVDDEYHLTLHKTNQFGQNTTSFDSKTIAFSEAAKGWISFRSFTPLTAVSITDRYYSINDNTIWRHHSDTAFRNNFYNSQYESNVEIIFNTQPGSVKAFKAINYEGSQAKVNQFTQQSATDAAGNTATYTDGEYYNLSSKNGWHVDSVQTDLEKGFIGEFIDKENKWYNYVRGSNTSLTTSSDYNQFEKLAVQGIGFPLVNPTDTQTESNVTIQAVSPDGENL